jgi:hypothetical protein
VTTHVKTMASKTSNKSTKIAKKAPAKRVAAKAAKPGKAVAKSSDNKAASKQIDKKIGGLGDWRGKTLAEIRKLIHEVDPEVVEDWKWMGTPVWSHDGMYVLANAHKDKVKVTFFHGAKLSDPKKLFNAGLSGNKWRAIDLREGDKINKTAFKALLRAAVAYNTTHSVPKSKGSREDILSKATPKAAKRPSRAGTGKAAAAKAKGAAGTGKAAAAKAAKRPSRAGTGKAAAAKAKGAAGTGKAAAAKAKGAAGKGTRSTATKSKGSSVNAKPALLAGGNPQIAKVDGDAPVQAYIAAMPDWKRDLGRRLDALIVRTVPAVRKAVKWNSPFYGIEGQGWFLSFHCFTKYVKVTFFRGASLSPVPPGTSKQKEVRYLDIHEDDPLDQDLVARWIRQASELPGWVP